MSKLEFICSKCSVCCRKANLDNLNASWGPGTIYWKRKANGDCFYLTDEGECSIYENRPRICNKEKNYIDWALPGKLAKISPYLIDKKHFFAFGSLLCNQMMDAARVDQSFRVDTSQYYSMSNGNYGK